MPFSIFRSSSREDQLIRRLLAERPDTTPLERHFIAPARDICQDRTDWVSVLFDTRNTVTNIGKTITATRAITLQGNLVWLVLKQGHKRAFHAASQDPHDAMAEAETAWRRRSEMRRRKAEVAEVVHKLRFLKVRHQVSVDDAYASPLCNEGVDGFLRAFGLDRFRVFPGWLIAWLYAFDRQVGYVLWEAHQRWKLEQAGLSPEVLAARDYLPVNDANARRDEASDYAYSVTDLGDYWTHDALAEMNRRLAVIGYRAEDGDCKGRSNS